MPAGTEFGTLVALWRERIGSIPTPSEWVCPRCCGPCWIQYSHCYGCERVFVDAPPVLRNKVVPISSTLEEGAWYGQLVAYKTTSRAPWPLLGGLVSHFASTHAERLKELLEGPPTALTVVPSKRGISVTEQPLYRVLQETLTWRQQALPRPSVLLEHTGAPVPRQTFTPEAFRALRRNRIREGRILLVEDSWTSGATAISAAGALLESGAAQVVVLPIARLVKASYWGEDHPYLKAMRQPYDISHWPR
jgi:hypothetical protein